MSFITVLPEGVLGAVAATAGLAGETAGHAGQVLGAGAVVPPGGPTEEVGIANVGRIQSHVAQVSSMLALAGVIKGLYGVSGGTAAETYLVSDAANDAGIVASIGGLV